MIELMKGLPDGVIGLRMSGEVTADEYRDVMVPALDEPLKRGGVRMLYVLAEHTKFHPGALFQDAKLGMGHLKGWERLAVVTDVDWVENMVKAFGWMMPGDVKVFDDDDLDDATAWLTRPTGSTAD